MRRTVWLGCRPTFLLCAGRPTDPAPPTPGVAPRPAPLARRLAEYGLGSGAKLSRGRFPPTPSSSGKRLGARSVRGAGGALAGTSAQRSEAWWGA
eukprot:1362700-Rhodomonas_salina.1